MLFPAFLMQADPPALASRIVVLETHADDRSDAGEGEGHHADQCTITQPHDARCLDTVQEFTRLLGVEDGGLAVFNYIFWAGDRAGRVCRDNLASDQPVVQHTYSRQMLPYRRFLDVLPQRLDVCGHML